MPRWLTRLRGAVGTALTWAIGWAGAGLGIGVLSVLAPALPWHLVFETFDAPLPMLAVPGFVGGLCFALVLGVAARRRPLRDLRVSHAAGWGALGGALTSALPFAMGAVGLATIAPIDAGELPSLLTVLTLITALSSGSAAVSLWMAQRADGREPPIDPLPLAEPRPADYFAQQSRSRHTS
ncbi:MAG: hypothetical protein LCH84_00455 [Gemmatimonadetes bacterium]|nr:hypothetical protein [Gemmatimonadota bacterium]